MDRHQTLSFPESLIAVVDAYRYAALCRAGLQRRPGRRMGGRALALRLLILRGLGAADASGLAEPAGSVARDGPTADSLRAWRAEVAARAAARDTPLFPPPPVPTLDFLVGADRPIGPKVRIGLGLPGRLRDWIDRFRERVEAHHPGARIPRTLAIEALVRWGLREEALHGPRDLSHDLRAGHAGTAMGAPDAPA
jgi:hypothetical protein